MSRADTEVPPGSYRHWKGGHYDVLAVGIHTETGERLVAYYQAGDRSVLFLRPVEMFLERIEYAGRRVRRFEPTERNASSE